MRRPLSAPEADASMKEEKQNSTDRLVEIMKAGAALVNAALAKASLPAISFRVSLSYGPVSAMLGERGEISDLFGATVTTCAKINRLADENTCVVGEALHNVLLPYYQDMKKKTEYRIGDSVSFSVFTLNYDKE